MAKMKLQLEDLFVDTFALSEGSEPALGITEPSAAPICSDGMPCGTRYTDCPCA